MCDPTNPDCTDPMCVDNPKCQNLKCMPTVDFGTLDAVGLVVDEDGEHHRHHRRRGDAVRARRRRHGRRRVHAHRPAPTLTLAWQQAQGEDHVFGLFLAGINQACGANPVDCVDPKEATSGQHTFPSLAGGHYYVITQAFEKAGAGPVTVTLSTPSMKEICNNGVDDNGNGLIDCADADCVNDPNCVEQECKPDFNVGALVVNGPAKSVSFDTTAADADNDVTCEGTPGGKDVVVRFTLRETGRHPPTLGSDRRPRGRAHAHAAAGRGVRRRSRSSCYDPSGRSMDEVAWAEKPAGDYVFIFKALKPGAEGHIDAHISAYRNAPRRALPQRHRRRRQRAHRLRRSRLLRRRRLQRRPSACPTSASAT